MSGCQPEDAASAVGAVERLCHDIGMPSQLADYGVTPARFDEIIADALKSGNVPVNPRAPGFEDMRVMLG